MTVSPERADAIPTALTPRASGVIRLLSSVGSERLQTASGSVPRQLDVDSRAWIEGLRATGAEHAAAIERLHDLLLRASIAEARRRRHVYPEIDGAELDDLCRQAADDA